VKQKDWILIIVIGFISTVLALVLSNLLLPSSSRQQKAEKVSPISSSFQQPDTKYFNPNAIDPTRIIRIGGEGPNNSPFNNPQQ
jgi:hypothetical protein